MATRTRDVNNYSGSRRNQLRHGRGSYSYDNKFFQYEGDWENGLKHGQGKLHLGDGGFYEGTFVRGEIEGHGYRVFGISGKSYSGQFRKGEMNGQGLMRWTDGSQYEGNFTDNVMEGEGIYSDNQGGLYEGSFHGNKKHGEGTQLYSNGDSYVGNWVMGKRQGHGTMTCSDGSTYTGQWYCDMYHGEGRLDHSSHVTFEGIWSSGIPSVCTSYLKLEGKTPVIRISQVDSFSISIICCQSSGEINTVDNGRLLKLSGGIKAIKTEEGNSDTLQKSSSKLSHYSIVQQPNLFDKKKSMHTPLGEVYSYELLQEPLKEDDGQKGASPKTLHVESLSPTAIQKLPSNQQSLQSSSFTLSTPKERHAEEDLYLQSLQEVSPVFTSSGRAVFTGLVLPPPPAPTLKTCEEQEGELLHNKKSKRTVKQDKLHKSLEPRRARHCPPGTYVVKVEDATRPTPWPNFSLNETFIEIDVLPVK